MLKRKTIDKRFVDYVFLAGLPADFRINPKEQESTDRLSLVVKENIKQGQSSSKEEPSEKNNATEQYNVVKEKGTKEDDETIKENEIVTKDIDTTSLNTTNESTSVLSNITLATTATSTTSTSDISDNNVSETFNMSGKSLNRSSTDFVVNDEESKRLFDSLFEGIKTKILKFDQERDEFINSMGKDIADKLNIGDFNNNNDVDDESKRKSATSKKSLKDIDEGFLETDSILSFSSNSTLKQEESTDNRTSYQNVVPQQPSSKQNDINPDALLHPLKQKFSPKLLSRYPKNDYPKEGAFPAYVPMFCFPNDIMIRESDTCPTTTFHGFVMTQEDGSQRYGVCLTTFEPIPDDLFEELIEQQKTWIEANMTPSEVEYAQNLNGKLRAERRRIETARAKMVLQGKDISSKEFEEIEKEKTDAKEKFALYNEVLQPIKLGVLDKSSLWIPKCIGIISHLPWHDVLKDWLCAVVMPMVEGLKERNDPTQSLIPLERYIVNLIHEIPLPPPGRLQVAMSVNKMTFFCTRPALNQMPVMKDFSLFPFFRSLSIKNIITLFEVALSEGKILLISSYPDMLYLVAHSITYLIYPFYWQGVFIPVLPARLMTCLQAPVPYIMGIERQYKGIDLLPEDACIVDIDKDTILMAEPPIQIPSRQRKKLIQSLEAYSPLHTRYSVPLGVPVFIQQAYPNGRFTPTSNRSKIYDKTSDKMGSVVGMPSRAIPLAPLMTSSFDPENGLMKFNSDDDSRIDQALQLVPICNSFNNESRSNNSNRSSSSSIGSNSRNVGFTATAAAAATGITTTHNMHARSNVSMGNINNINIPNNNNNNNSAHAIQRRFSNFVSPSNGFSDIRSERSLDKFGKKTKQRFSSITGGARNSIMTLKNKALTRNSVFSHSRSGSINTNNNSVIVTPASPDSTNFSRSSFDDASNTISKSPDKLPLGAISEKDYIPKEGHLMVLLSLDNEECGQKSGINTWKMEGLACGICRNSLGINPVYKCEGCSMMIHDECLTDVAYPCVPACFDETKIVDAFLRVFASLLRNYRSYLNNDNTTSDIHENGFDDAGDANELFKKDLFLKNFDKDARGFLSNLVDSQSFSQFISERAIRKSEDYEIRYFDEIIKAKLNRSKLKLSKESTTFLDGSSFDVSQTVRAMKPNEEGLDELGFEGYICLPDCFDPELMSTPRPVRDGWANGFGKGWR